MTWDSARILATLPHRYPFLLVDRVLEVEAGRRAVGLKNVSLNDWFFQGHFPGRPIMPGVLIIEALAQLVAIALLTETGNEGQIPYFAGIDACRFRRPVVPGDVLRLEAELTRARARVGKGHGRATVDGQLVAEADMLFALGPANETAAGSAG
ncbi:MAG TPA: 3-hydroxyacyl-ACP dehydratase FabZ [Dehalococcoidia bacterium]|nr:3-hydroxyacyl-ACP dehydratase FabZ [Dehalococcoidia bacterium]